MIQWRKSIPFFFPTSLFPFRKFPPMENKNPRGLAADRDLESLWQHRYLGVCFALRPAVFKTQHCWKYTEWPPELPEAFNFTSILYTLSTGTHPSGPNFTQFHPLRPAIFKIQDCRKSEMHQITLGWPQALNCQQYPVYTEYSPPPPPEAQISLFRPMTSRF